MLKLVAIALILVQCGLLVSASLLGANTKDKCPFFKDGEKIRDTCREETDSGLSENCYCELLDLISNLTMSEKEFSEKAEPYAELFECSFKKIGLLTANGEFNVEFAPKLLEAFGGIDLGAVNELIADLVDCVSLCPITDDDKGLSLLLRCWARALDKKCGTKIFGENCYSEGG